MDMVKKAFSKRLYFYAAYLVFAIIYLVVSLLAPLGPNRFNLSTTHTRELQAAILLPLLLIWLAAIYGAEKLYDYTRLIKNSKDGKALSVLSSGLSLLVASILINAFIGLFRPWALKDGWLAAYTIFSNYLGILLPLAAYVVLHNGSLRLLSSIKAKPSKKSWLAIIILMLIIGAGYLAAMFSYDYRVSTPDPSKFSSFYMSDVLIALTICLPYLIGWALAIKAMLNLDQYRRQVKGLIYKRSLLRLEAGLLVVIFFYIIIQLLIAFSTYFAHAGLGSILAFLYLLIFFYAIGFLVIAAGTSRLTQIEKVK
jgi:hypothetical protein